MRRSPWLLPFVLALATACAETPEPKPELRPFEDIGAESSGVAPLGSANLMPTGPDMLGFPPVTGLSPGDYSFAESPEGPLKGYITKFYRIRHVVGAQLIAVLNNWKTPQGRIIDMALHNMLIITEKQDVLEVMERILEQIDRVPAQIEIEAKIIEIRRSSNYEFGFELHVDRSPAANTAFRRFDGAFNSSSFLSSLRPGSSPYQGASINWAAIGKAQQVLGDFEYVLRALERDGYAEVLSAPRIVVHSGRRAMLSAKTQEPVQVTNIIPGNFQQITTEFRPVGVQLEVTPVVVGTEAILVDVKPSVSTVVNFLPSATGGPPLPRIAERSADTQVDLRNGELLVIGGLFEKRIRKDNSRVPIVGHVPLLGKLLSSIDDEEIKTDIVFVLKLRILSNVERADERLRSIPGGGK
ncbi:MAG: type II secretion system protein GspD [Planctomycetota bacterium]